jgi:hypothetical protein
LDFLDHLGYAEHVAMVGWYLWMGGWFICY